MYRVQCSPTRRTQQCGIEDLNHLITPPPRSIEETFPQDFPSINVYVIRYYDSKELNVIVLN